MVKHEKLLLPITILIASVVIGGFYYMAQINKQESAERQQQAELEAEAAQAQIEKKNIEEKEALEKLERVQQEELEKEEAAEEQRKEEQFARIVNNCITDAYTELKTLQWNIDYAKNLDCSNNPAYCTSGIEFWNGEKDKAFIKYRDEWVPQCKLGNRVFIHYEPM
jgi:ferredoxin-like protein FixX